jgi:3-isopropylmalate/(R)-2-methylmalate dehydratase small subunit
VSPRIADIFRNNSTRSGLVPAEVDAAAWRHLLEAVIADPGLELVVDVERRVIEAPALGETVPFTLDDVARERLLQGLDDIGVTLGYSAAIDDYEARRPTFLPHVG